MLFTSALLILDLFAPCHPFTLDISDFELKHGVVDVALVLLYWSLDWRAPAERKLAAELITSPNKVLTSAFQKCLPDNFILDGIIQEVRKGGLKLEDVHFSTYSYVHTARIQQLYSGSNPPYNPDIVLFDDIHPDRLSRSAFDQVIDLASKHPEIIGDRQIEKKIASWLFPHSWMYLSKFRTHIVAQELAETKPLILILTLMIQKGFDRNYDVIYNLLKGKSGQEVTLFRRILETRLRESIVRKYTTVLKSAVQTLEISFHSLWYGRMSLAVLGLCIRDFSFRDNLPPFCLEPAFEWLSKFPAPKIAPYQFQELIKLLNKLRRNPFRYFKSFGALDRARMAHLARRFPGMTCPWLDIEEQIHIWKQSLPNAGYLDESLSDFPLKHIMSKRFIALMGQYTDLSAAIRFHPELRNQLSVEFQDGSIIECADTKCLMEAAYRSLIYEYRILESLSEISHKTGVDNVRLAVKAFARMLLLNLVQNGVFGIKLERDMINVITVMDSVALQERNINLIRDLIANTGIWNWLSSWEIRAIAFRNSDRFSLTDKLATGVSSGIIILIVLCSTLITIYWKDITSEDMKL